MKKLLLLIVFSAGCIFAQSGIPGDDSKNSLMPPFYVNVLSAKSKAEGKSKFDIYFEVPFEGLQFLHADSVFTGLYRITCTITDESKENIFYDQSWLETVKTNSFEETTNPMNSNYSQKSVDLAPGKYRVSCNMQDVDSKRYYLFDGVFTLRSYKDSVGVSDPFIIDRTIKDNGVDQLIPNTARIITTKDKEIPVFFEAYADKPGSYSFEYCLRDAGGNIFYSKADTIIKLKAGTNEIYYTLKDFKLTIGSGTLLVNLKKGDKVLASSSVPINAQIYGLPFSITELDDAIDEMVYITSAETMNELKSITVYEEKLKKFIEFWDAKKPYKNLDYNPILAEYYKRVEYANHHFKGIPMGWKSDMGMVYIILGPPDMVKREPMPAESNPYEVWMYRNLNREYVFLDVSGFGSYKLQNPDYDILSTGGIR